MQVYLMVARQAFRRSATYRAAYISGMITNTFFGAMLCYVFLAVYGSRSSMADYSVNDTITYLWVAQAMISIGGAWVTADLSRAIRSGDVAVELMRPWNYYFFWLSQQLGERAFNLILRGIITYSLGVMLFAARLPALADLPGFLVALAFAVLISTALNFLWNASAFWFLDNQGVVTIGSVLTMFFSGFLVPLAFFPPWLATIAQILPFRAITSIPIEAFLGKLRGAELLLALGVQLFWVVLLTLAALLLMRRAMHKLIIQGG
ncbi:MAG: ABC-2 family transporter protein [Roseiflexaceae bacterium]